MNQTLPPATLAHPPTNTEELDSLAEPPPYTPLQASFWKLLPVVVLGNVRRGLVTRILFDIQELGICSFTGRRPGQQQDVCTWIPPLRMLSLGSAILLTSCVANTLTAGWWTRLSDRSGRKPVLFASSYATALADLAITSTVYPLGTRISNGSFSFILWTELLKNVFGGQLTYTAMLHAYTSDCVNANSRTGYFSVLRGLGLFSQMTRYFAAVFLWKQPDSSPDMQSITRAAAGLSGVLMLYVLFVLPESLPRAPPIDTGNDPVAAFSWRGFIDAIPLPFTSFSPHVTTPRSYNMTFIGVALFILSLTAGVSPFKESYRFIRWNIDQQPINNGMIAQIVVYVVLIPALAAYLQPKSRILLGATLQDKLKPIITFGMYLAACSIFLEAVFEASLAIFLPMLHRIPYELLAFYATAFTVGAAPAIYSLAAVHYQSLGRSSDFGLLFGALGVIENIGRTISLVVNAFGKPAGSHAAARAIFLVSAGFQVVVALLLIAVGRVASCNPGIDPEETRNIVEEPPEYVALDE